MKNIEIASIVNIYQSGEGEIKLPAAVAWKRRLNMVKLIEAKHIIDDAIREISERYSDDEHSVADGDGRKVKPEYIADFGKEKADILTQETDIDIKKVPIEALGDIELTDTQLNTIAFMIEEGE